MEQTSLCFPPLDNFVPAGGALSGNPSSGCLAQAQFALLTLSLAKRELLLLCTRAGGESCAGVTVGSDAVLLAEQHQGRSATGLAGVSRRMQGYEKAKLISST